jgi:two-component system, OmpR family, alkaline phosphatase synthesis response regulator PhoP
MKKILIVEDERTILGPLTKKLEKEGFDVQQAPDGEIGLRTALQKRPDLILLDIVMPEMDGMTMLENLRTDTWGRDVPVVILTNLDDGKKVAEATKHGSFDYLVKSDWSVSDVVDKIKQKLL